MTRRTAAVVATLAPLFATAPAPAPAVPVPATPAPAPREEAAPDLAVDVARRIRDLGLVGAGLGVIRQDGTVWARGFGMADKEEGVAASPGTASSWASSGKTVVCAAVVKALEASGIGLDAPINAHLPFAVVNPGFPATPITFRTLLVHTSSIHHDRELASSLSTTGDPTLPLGAFLREYLVPGGRYYRSTNFLQAPPGSRWEYSNVGYSLLAFLVERLAGVPFEEYCARELFAPLGMRRAGWFLRELDVSALAHQYVAGPSTPGALRRVEHFSWPGYPDGSLRCSVADMLRLLAMHLDGGQLDGVRVLTPRAVEAIFTGQKVAGAWSGGRNPLVTIDTGLAWRLYELDGREVWSHNGGGGAGMSTILLLDRKAKAAAAAWVSGPLFDTKGGQEFFVELHHRLLAEMLRSR